MQTYTSNKMEADVLIDNLKIHFEECGNPEGLPVLIMHGWGCSHSTVKSISTILQPNFHIFNVDLPGHGLSDEPNSVWGIEEFSRLMEKFVDYMHIDNPILIGHSFGGRIAILMASRNKTRKVILIDSAGIKPHRGLTYYRKVYSFKLMKHFVMILFGKNRGNEMVERMRSNKGSSDYRNSTPMMRAIMSKCVNEDLKRVMPLIDSPTLLIWGAEDTATPLSDARTMEKLIPDAGLVSFDGCGHYSFLDNPLGFKAVVAEFLKNEAKEERRKNF